MHTHLHLHRPGRLVALLVLTALIPLASACGEATDPCAESCQVIRECTGGASAGAPASLGFYCPQTGACGEQASCQALCVAEASCDAIADRDSAGVSRLKGCMAACSGGGVSPTQQPPAQPPAQSPPQTPVASCTPNCAGKTCGDDGCGGSCGSCKQSYLACDAASGTCQPKTPSYCFGLNECDYVGQVKCTTADRYRLCYKSSKGCLYLDCFT